MAMYTIAITLLITQLEDETTNQYGMPMMLQLEESLHH